MVRLMSDSPEMTRCRTRRQWHSCLPQFLKRPLSVILIVILMTALGHYFFWSSTNDHYTVSPRDMNFIQSFCSVIQPTIGGSQPDNANSAELQDALQDTGEQHAQIEHLAMSHLRPNFDHDKESIPDSVWQDLPVKGAFYMFLENDMLPQARASIRSIEDRFNRDFRYPWVLLNHQYFSVDVRKYLLQSTNAPVYFGKVDLEAWNYPEWISAERAEERMQTMAENNVYKGGSLIYRQFSRYHAGGFFHHSLFQNVDYVWRVAPGTHYSCDMEYDPFKLMHEQNKVFGFALSERDAPNAMTSLWPLTLKFKETLPRFVLPENDTIMPWLQMDQDNIFCQFTSHFQIVKLSFLRSLPYQMYFSYLDKIGGFFYERWSDGVVQTMAAAMFLRREEIYFFDQIGLGHGLTERCPISTSYASQKCACDIKLSHDFERESCSLSLFNHIDRDRLLEVIDTVHNRRSFRDGILMDLIEGGGRKRD